MRVLGRIRLSRLTEESTSVEKQKEYIQNWAAMHNHQIVAWAIDVNVSGTISPFDSPELGPYLHEPLMHDWDIVCALKLDRFARRSITLHKLFSWVQENDKQLVCISDNIDLSTWVGRLIASVIAGVAEGELEAISERIQQTYTRSRKLGRWVGGRMPYGFRKATTPDSPYALEEDPEQIIVLHEMVDRVLAGASINSIVNWLNDENIPTSLSSDNKTYKWSASTVRRMLTSRTLMGWVMLHGKPVLDEEGNPVQQGPSLISAEVFEKLQKQISSRSHKNQPTNKPNLLLGVLKCWDCGQPMYAQRVRKNNEIHGYYRCKANCSYGRIPEDVVTNQVFARFSQELGEHRIRTRVPKQQTHVLEEQLAEAQLAYEDLATFIPTITTNEARKSLFAQLTQLDKKINNITQQLENNQDEWVEGEGTYRDTWDTLTQPERQQFLAKLGITAKARLARTGFPRLLEIHMDVPKDLLEQLGK